MVQTVEGIHKNDRKPEKGDIRKETEVLKKRKQYKKKNPQMDDQERERLIFCKEPIN